MLWSTYYHHILDEVKAFIASHQIILLEMTRIYLARKTWCQKFLVFISSLKLSEKKSILWCFDQGYQNTKQWKPKTVHFRTHTSNSNVKDIKLQHVNRNSLSIDCSLLSLASCCSINWFCGFSSLLPKSTERVRTRSKEIVLRYIFMPHCNTLTLNLVTKIKDCGCIGINL